MMPLELRRWRWAAIALIALITCLPLPAGATSEQSGKPIATAAARIRHVFIIMLENKDYQDTFGTSMQDPYLQKTLIPMGALLTQYYGTGHASLDNYLSLISGQAATDETSDDCITHSAGGLGNFDDMVQTGTAAQGQIVVSGGCVYPAHVKTLANQLQQAHYSWKGYMEDMGNDPARESATCGHPAIGIGTDRTTVAEAPSNSIPQGDGYAMRHDPFMYFHAIIDSPACRQEVVNLKALDGDLRQARTTPNLAFITPNLCNDGHDGSGTGEQGKTCADGKPGGLTSADAFLHTWVPKITASPAFRKDGLLIITFDESSYARTVTTDAATGQKVVSIVFPGESCCHQQPGPNLTRGRPAIVVLMDTPTLKQNLVTSSFGGDRIGALLLSPFIKPGSASDIQYNHYSLLRSLEDIFRLPDHLGYAENDPASDYQLDTIGEDTGLWRTP